MPFSSIFLLLCSPDSLRNSNSVYESTKIGTCCHGAFVQESPECMDSEQVFFERSCEEVCLEE